MPSTKRTAPKKTALQSAATKKVIATTSIQKPGLNVHLVLPDDLELDIKQTRVTFNGTQIIIEFGGSSPVESQVEGVKKVPVPPRPGKALKLPLIRVTASKKKSGS